MTGLDSKRQDSLSPVPLVLSPCCQSRRFCSPHSARCTPTIHRRHGIAAAMYSALLSLLLFILQCLAAPEPDPFRTPLAPSASATQSLESILQSIEDRLRSLDNVYSLRFAAPRWELSVETQTRKLEALESKLSRIETLVELRIDKITEGLHSKTLKEELAKDQLSRKIDTIYERLNHRMSYMESRIENNIAKLQATIDATLNRINQQLEHVDKNVNMIETDVVEVSTGMEDIKATLSGLNSTLIASMGSGGDGGTRAAITDMVKKVQENQKEIIFKVEENVEIARKSLTFVNGTKKELQEGLQSLNTYRDALCLNIPDDTFDIILGKVDTLSRKNEGHYHKLDYTINRLIEKQDMFQESCLRIQQEEPQIEDRIITILEKVLYIMDDRSNLTDKNYENLLEGLKNHHKHMLLNVSQVTSHVIKLSNQITEEFKAFYNEIVLNNPTSDKIDSIISSLQDLQDSFLEVNATLNNSTEHSLGQGQQMAIANATQTILMLIHTLNDNINTIIDKLNDYYKEYTGAAVEELDESLKSVDNASRKILQIFNMTEEDLDKVPHTSASAVLNHTIMAQGETRDNG